MAYSAMKDVINETFVITPKHIEVMRSVLQKRTADQVSTRYHQILYRNAHNWKYFTDNYELMILKEIMSRKRL